MLIYPLNMLLLDLVVKRALKFLLLTFTTWLLLPLLDQTKLFKLLTYKSTLVTSMHGWEFTNGFYTFTPIEMKLKHSKLMLTSKELKTVMSAIVSLLLIWILLEQFTLITPTQQFKILVTCTKLVIFSMLKLSSLMPHTQRNLTSSHYTSRMTKVEFSTSQVSLLIHGMEPV